MLTRDEVLARAIETAERTEQGCLIPTAWVPMNTGYVRVRADGIDVMLHRLVVGDIAAGLTVDHECHNADRTCPGGPCIHRRCFERSHLFVRPQRENWERGRLGGTVTMAAKTHCPKGHPLVPGNLRAGRYRACLTCHRDRMAASRAR